MQDRAFPLQTAPQEAAPDALSEAGFLAHGGFRGNPEDGISPAKAAPMEQPDLSFYHRRLRMMHCREQQLIGLLPDLVSEAVRPDLKEAMAGYRAAARCRRYMIIAQASDHGIFPHGDECLAMRKMIAVGSARLAAESRGRRHDRSVETFCHEVHRVIMIDYRLTRDLAVELGLPADVECFDEVLEAMAVVFPKRPPQPARLIGHSSPQAA